MTTFIHCRSAVLAEMVAVADGGQPAELEPCEELATHVVVIRRRGLEVAAELCRGHDRDAPDMDGYVRSIAKYTRT